MRLGIGSTHVMVSRDGPLAVIRNMPIMLTEQLFVPLWQPAVRLGGVRAIKGRRPLVRVKPLCGEHAHACAAGVAPVVVRYLERAGFEVNFGGRWIAPLPPVRLPQMGDGPRDHGLLAAIAGHSHLQLRHGPAVRPEDLAVMLGSAWRALRLVVAVARVDEARRMVYTLRAAGLDAALATHRHYPREGGRVFVTTYGSLGWSAVGIHDLDFLLLPNAIEALGNRPRDFVIPGYWPGGQRVPRQIGMVPAGRRLAPADQIGLLETCGPWVYSMPALELVGRRVKFCFVHAGGRRFAHGLGQTPAVVVDLLRVSVWHDPVRNRRLARLARLIAAGNDAALATDFPTVANRNDLALPAAVAVVVHGMEHANALSAHLPDWSIINRSEEQTNGTNDTPMSPGQIITLDGLRDLPVLDAGIIIRADGGTGGLTLPALSMAGPSSAPPLPLLVVDCDDRHHPELRRRARARRAAYREAGWLRVGQDQVDVALDLILQEGRP
jgi:hypothetical protein